MAEFAAGLATQHGKIAANVERDFFKHARPSSLLERFETPDEIAVFTASIASPRASVVDGPTLRVDGGVVRSIG